MMFTQIMSQFFACGDYFSSDCKWTIFADTQNEIVSEVSKHAKVEHDVNNLSDKMVADINNNSETI